jgi:hypothetical protein
VQVVGREFGGADKVVLKFIDSNNDAATLAHVTTDGTDPFTTQVPSGR